MLAAVVALGLSFAPFLNYPVDARRLSQFSTGQPPAYWFGRAAIVLVVVAAATAKKSLRIAAGCAIAAVATIAATVVVTSLRQVSSVGWTTYAGGSVSLPEVHASPMWGVGALLATATLAAAACILALTRSDIPQFRVRVVVVGLFGLAAFIASLALVDAEGPGASGQPRRYADYLAVPSASTLGVTNRWFAVGSVVLIVLAVIAARARLGFSARQPA
jgi:hypothetical protein